MRPITESELYIHVCSSRCTAKLHPLARIVDRNTRVDVTYNPIHISLSLNKRNVTDQLLFYPRTTVDFTIINYLIDTPFFRSEPKNTSKVTHISATTVKR